MLRYRGLGTGGADLDVVNPAAREDHDSVADVRQLLEIGAGAEHGGAGLRGRPDGPEQLLPRADVDALRGLVQHQQLGMLGQPFRDQNLLGVAPAQRRQGQAGIVRANLEGGAKLTRAPPECGPVEPEPAYEAAQGQHGEVLADG